MLLSHFGIDLNPGLLGGMATDKLARPPLLSLDFGVSKSAGVEAGFGESDCGVSGGERIAIAE